MPVSACIVSSSPHNIAQTPAALLLPPFSTRSPSPSGSNVVALPDDALYLEPASEPRPGTSLTARLHTHTHTHTHTHPPIRGRHSPFPLAYNCNCNCITARPDLNYLLSGPPSDHTLIHPPPPPVSLPTLCEWLCRKYSISTTLRSCCPPYTCTRAVRSRVPTTARIPSSERSDNSHPSIPLLSPHPDDIHPPIAFARLPTNRSPSLFRHHHHHHANGCRPPTSAVNLLR